MTTVSNALGHTQHSYTYDAYGRLASDTDSQGYTRQYSYDALDRLTAITYPDGTRRQYTWDKLELASYTDRQGNTTQYTYDAERNLIQVTDPMGQTTQYGYYANGRLHTMTGPNGNTTTWTRDLEGRVVSKTYADGNGTSYVYDNSSRLASVTDALGQSREYAYDRDDLLTGIHYANAVNPTPSATFDYGSDYPRLIAMRDGHGMTVYSYYPAGVLGAGRLASEQGTDTHDSLKYAYDALGRLASRTVDGAQETYRYDAIDRLNGVTNPLGDFTSTYLGDTTQTADQSIANVPYQVNYQYESNLGDRRLKAIQNSTIVNGRILPVENYTFTTSPEALILSRAVDDGSSRGRRRHHDWDEGRHKGWRHALHRGVIAQLYRELDHDDWHKSERGEKAGHDDDRGHEDRHEHERDHRANKGRVLTQYLYDNSYRLTGAQGGSKESYGYDAAGNITAMSAGGSSTNFAVNSLNQIQSAGTTTYSYDANGNLLDDGTHTYAWDAADRLVTITNKQSGHTSEFSYDGLSRRVSDTETDPGATAVTTKFLWCGQTLCEKRDAGDAVLARYYAQGEQHNGQPYFYAQDQVGSVTALVDSTGKVVGRLSYDSYGNLTGSSGTVLPDYRYAGLYYHADSGLYLATYRAYDAKTGRWISRDPIREAGGINLYEYSFNNPILFSDTFGMAPNKTCVAVCTIGGGIIGGGLGYLGGGLVGGAGGTLVLPGVGTVGGAIGGADVGGAAGATAGSTAGNAAGRAFCPDDNSNDFCYKRWEKEDSRCWQWKGLGMRVVSACQSRAAHRRNLCKGNGGKPNPDEPPEYNPFVDYPR